MEQKNTKDLKIDTNLMNNGNPDLVKPDIETDIPKSLVIQNKVELDKVYREEKRVYMLDLYIQSLPEEKQKYMKSVSTIAYKVINQL